ncbi:MAG: sugar kinase [Spirochaetaceae bacterium]|nr:sugar kinase [Spirochaetaceae bacterium]
MPQTVPYDAIKPASACRHDLIALGEVMLRFDPRDVPTARMRDNVRVSQGGGETNVACGAAYTFGLRAGVLTALVDDPVGENIRNQLREAGVDVSNVRWWNTDGDGAYSTDQKGTLHNGISFTTAGRGVLPSETVYYRANTPAARMKPGDFDFERLFAEEGTRVFSTGGILTLIGSETADLAIEAASTAQANGTFVAADLNYRSKVEPNKERARAINQRLAPYLSMLVGNDSDLYDAFGYDTAEPERDTFEDWLAVYQDTIVKVARDFPNLSLVGTQWRGAHDADEISWGAVLYDCRADTWYAAPVREHVHITDRTGGGDSFACGVLAALMKGHSLDTAVNWGAAHGILVQETPGDITMVNERAVVAEVKRAAAGGGVKAAR